MGFIFDPRNDLVLDTVNKLPEELGTGIIYHVTISPGNLSATDVADGKFDTQYTAFFQAVKKNNLKVVFRTMHEMNGGRYPWSSNPEAFKKAWIHVWNLSRDLGLDKTNILFDMSVNHRDMPTKDKTPDQTSKLITCKQPYKKTVSKKIYSEVPVTAPSFSRN